MEIYVEYVLIDNLVINFLILYLSCKFLKYKIVFWKLALASCLGAACALVLPLVSLPAYLMILLKLILGVVMVLISLPCRNVKKSIVSILVFLMVTAGMGGICFLIIFMLSGTISTDILITYTSDFPVGAILLICSLAAFLVNRLVKLFYRKKSLNNFVFETIILHEGKKLKIDAYLDSGNTLIDPVTNKPVVIINYSLFNKLYNLPMEKLITKNIEKEVKNSHYITFNTIGKKSEMLVFEIDGLEVNISGNQKKQFEKVILGLSFSKLNKTFSCDALLHPQLICN